MLKYNLLSAAFQHLTYIQGLPCAVQADRVPLQAQQLLLGQEQLPQPSLSKRRQQQQQRCQPRPANAKRPRDRRGRASRRAGPRTWAAPARQRLQEEGRALTETL